MLSEDDDDVLDELMSCFGDASNVSAAGNDFVGVDVGVVPVGAATVVGDASCCLSLVDVDWTVGGIIMANVDSGCDWFGGICS